ncbi:unnamed protein product [Schistosoma mattheei]|uniref:Uncharacterized protein n=1 Tax=Schistosoma mattheei TaxID=31246 RepID=A0A183NSB9_9TREM|nr:unnamed protein product [Schistosoma mattheei]
MFFVLYRLQSIYSALTRRFSNPRKVLTARCGFDVSWFVTPFPSNSSRPLIIRHKSYAFVIYNIYI